MKHFSFSIWNYVQDVEFETIKTPCATETYAEKQFFEFSNLVDNVSKECYGLICHTEHGMIRMSYEFLHHSVIRLNITETEIENDNTHSE
jgi:hypothetical protein